MQQFKYDLILTGGRVVDPQNGFKGIASVAVRDGNIVECRRSLSRRCAAAVD
jgi:predicted amidohydrolase